MAPKRGIPFTKHLWDQSRTPNIQQTPYFPMTELVLFDPKLLFSLTQKWSQNMTTDMTINSTDALEIIVNLWCLFFFWGCVFPNVPQFMAKETRAAYCLVRYIEEYNSLFYRQPKGFQPPLLNRLITPWNQSRVICQWYPHIRYP